MNAIQYGAEAGALGQIAQGNSLRRVFGTGAGFQESYSAMANTQADMQNYTARETTRSAREHFGNSLRGGGSSGISFADAARGNADLKHDQFAGTAQGYNEGVAFDKSNGRDGRVFQESAKAQTHTQGKTTSNILKQEENNVKETEQASQRDANQAEYQQKVDASSQNAKTQLEGVVKSIADIDTGKKDFRGNAIRAMSESAKEDFSKFATDVGSEHKANVDAAQKTLDAKTKELDTQAKGRSYDRMVDNMSDSNVLKYSQSSADVSSAYSTGIMSNGMVTSAGMSAMVMNSMQQHHKMLAMNDTFGNTPQQKQALNEFMNNVGLSALEKQSVLSAGSPAERVNRFLSYTRANQLQGSYQGRSFNATLSTDGQFNGKFDSSVNFVGGYRSDMGEAWTYQVHRAYGSEGARNWGIVKSTYTGITDLISVGTDFMGGIGKVGKMGKGFGGGRAPSNAQVMEGE